jgi:endonuclease III
MRAGARGVCIRPDVWFLRTRNMGVRASHERLPAAARAPQDHGSTFQLLVAVILSAQTTDKKVNEVTPALFAAAGDAAGMAALEARLTRA